MTKDGETSHTISCLKWLDAGLPLFDQADGDPVIYSKRSLADSAKGEAESDGDRFFIGVWCSVILSLEALGFVMWWLL